MESDHVLPKLYLKNNCSQHFTADLAATEGYAVEFVYIFPKALNTKEGGLEEYFKVLR